MMKPNVAEALKDDGIVFKSIGQPMEYQSQRAPYVLPVHNTKRSAACVRCATSVRADLRAYEPPVEF